MTTRTHYVIQIGDPDDGTFHDMPGMPNGGRGYDSADEARAAYAAKFQPLERNLTAAQFRIVERVVTDTPIQL